MLFFLLMKLKFVDEAMKFLHQIYERFDKIFWIH